MIGFYPPSGRAAGDPFGDVPHHALAGSASLLVVKSSHACATDRAAGAVRERPRAKSVRASRSLPLRCKAGVVPGFSRATNG
jgi:hypothetical protein